jgi:hypothetical protein
MSSGASSLSAMTCWMTKSKTSKLFWILAFYPGNAFPEITAFLLQHILQKLDGHTFKITIGIQRS